MIQNHLPSVLWASVLRAPVLIAMCLGTCWLSGSLCGQDPFGDNPFGDSAPAGTDPFGNAAATGDMFGADPNATSSAAVVNAPVLMEDADPIVRALRSNPPRTPKQWADALTWMVRIKRWDEVKRLLNELQTADWSLDEKAQLSREAGATIWYRIRQADAELTPEQLQLVGQLLAAPGQLARDTASIDRWITALASQDMAQRKRALQGLHDGGLVALQRLTERLLDGSSGVDPQTLAVTIDSFGRDGRDALRAACVVGDPARAGRVLLAIAALPRLQFATELGAALASRSLPIDVQQAIGQTLSSKVGSLPNAAAVNEYLQKQFSEALAEYQDARSIQTNTLADSYVWRPTADGSSLQLIQAPQTQRALERLGQLAAQRANLINASRSDLIESGAVLLQRAYQVNPSLDAGEWESGLLTSLDQELVEDAAYWQQLVDTADAWQMHGASLRAMQGLVEHAQLADYTAPLDFLVQRLSDPRPVIRYAALQAIAEIDPQLAFAGADKAIETALEMISLGNGPHVLVIGLQPELRQAASQLLSAQRDSPVTEANSGQAALQALNGMQPIELIMLVDRVADMSVYELLQRLRKTQHGQSLPIAVLTDRLYQHEWRLMDEMAGIVPSVLSYDGAHMDRIVNRLLDTLDTNPLSTSDRAQLSRTAGDFLAKLASDRQLYDFYPLGDWRERLISTQAELPLASQMTVLAAIGSAEGQAQLVSMAANGSLNEQERVNAAKAFGSSVRRFGMLLDSDGVLNNYDLYNRLGPTDPVAVKALGLVLDVTEAQAGKMDWPQGL